MENFFGGLIALLVLGLVSWGGYEAYWAIEKSNTQHHYEINTGTQQYQAGLISHARALVLDWHRVTDAGQKIAIADQFCEVYPNITPPPADLVNEQPLICKGR